jgi:hypothetical protein
VNRFPKGSAVRVTTGYYQNMTATVVKQVGPFVTVRTESDNELHFNAAHLTKA